MADVATDNGKLAVMSLGRVYRPNVIFSDGSLDQADQQQLLWGFPEVLWGEASPDLPNRGTVVRGGASNRVVSGGASVRTVRGGNF